MHDAIKKEVGVIVKEASAHAKKVDANKIKDIKFLGYGILEKLSKYVEGMDKKTSLDINDLESNIRFRFYNPIAADNNVKVFRSSVYDKPTLSHDNIAIPFNKNLSKITERSDIFLSTHTSSYTVSSSSGGGGGGHSSSSGSSGGGHSSGGGRHG